MSFGSSDETAQPRGFEEGLLFRIHGLVIQRGLQESERRFDSLASQIGRHDYMVSGVEAATFDEHARQANRDTLRFAMEANAMRDTAGVWHDVAKAPATDPGKASKAGRPAVIMQDGRPAATRLEGMGEADNHLQPVWRNGTLLVRHSFDDLRARAG